MGYINSVLSDFSLKISFDRIRDNTGTIITCSKLQPLDGISEIIEYRMRKSLVLHDEQKIFNKPTTYIYNHLIIQQEQWEKPIGKCSLVGWIITVLFPFL